MRYATGLAVVLAVTGSALALEPAEAQQRRLGEIRALANEGKYAEAAEAARALAAGVHDKDVKTEATRLLAEALRKNGDWRPAAKAYGDLAGMYEKGSEAAVRAQATAEVLAKSPQGVYPGLAKPAAAEGPRTLAEDEVLAEVLAAVGEARAAALGPKVAAMKKAATPAEAATALEEILAAFAEARMLAPEMSYEAEREAAKGAAERLESLGNEAKPKLREKLAEYDQAAAAQSGLNSAQKAEVEQYHQLCVQSAEAEVKFRERVREAGGPGWMERVRLVFDSTRRNHEYGLLAVGFHRVSLWRGGDREDRGRRR